MNIPLLKIFNTYSMQRLNLKYPFIFILLVILQVLIFNSVYLGGYLNPQVYVFFILFLPVNIRGYVLLLVAFLLGLLVDVFSDTLAIHAFASVLMAFCRPAVIRLFAGNIDPENTSAPSFYGFGAFSLIMYSFVLILVHHLSLFTMEIFRFDEFFQTLNRAALSTGLTLVFVMLAFALNEGSSAGKRY